MLASFALLAGLQIQSPPQAVKREAFLAEVAKQAAPHLIPNVRYQFTAAPTAFTISRLDPGRNKALHGVWKWSDSASTVTFLSRPNLGKGVRKDISAKALAALLPYNSPRKGETTKSYFSFETLAKGAKVSAFFERLPLTPGAHTILVVSQDGKLLKTIPGE